MTTEIANILNCAADIIEGGWTRGALRRGNCYCLDGAILAATGYDVPEQENFDACNLAYRHLRRNPKCSAAVKAVADEIGLNDSWPFIGEYAPHEIAYVFNDQVLDAACVISLLRNIAAKALEL